MTFKKNIVIAALGLLMSVGTIAGASAATPWQASHPARTEINHRLVNENVRINHDLRSGKIGYRQAMRLHRDAHFIRAQERVDARFHRSHLTRFEAHRLNHEENRLNHKL